MKQIVRRYTLLFSSLTYGVYFEISIGAKLGFYLKIIDLRSTRLWDFSIPIFKKILHSQLLFLDVGEGIRKWRMINTNRFNVNKNILKEKQRNWYTRRMNRWKRIYWNDRKIMHDPRPSWNQKWILFILSYIGANQIQVSKFGCLPNPSWIMTSGNFYRRYGEGRIMHEEHI
jgi:hypothetical protein